MPQFTLSSAKRFIAIIVAGTAFTVSTHSQSSASPQNATKPDAFDVVSIKPSQTGDGDGLSHTTPNEVFMPGATVQSLIFGAYDLKRPEQIVGLPAWASTEKFDVLIKVDADPTVSPKMRTEERQKQQAVRMQSLLEQRFGLMIHRESKLGPAYDLTVAKDGPKMKTADADAHAYLQIGRDRFVGDGLPIGSLVFVLSSKVDRIVVDKTNLPGKYQIDLKWTSEEPQPLTNGDFNVSIFTALQEQLGLKLEPAKELMNVIVVDRIEPLREN